MAWVHGLLLGGVDAHEAISRSLGDLFNVSGASVDGQRKAVPLHNTRLAHHHELFGCQRRIVDTQGSLSGLGAQPSRKISRHSAKAICPKRIDQVRKAGRIKQNDAVQPNRFWVQHQLNDCLGHVEQRVAHIQRCVAHDSFKGTQTRVASFFEKGCKQVRFAFKMVIECAFGNTSSLCNLRHRGAVIAILDKNKAGPMKNLCTFCVHRSSRVFRACVCHCRGRVFHGVGRLLHMLTQPFGHCKSWFVFPSFISGAVL